LVVAAAAAEELGEVAKAPVLERAQLVEREALHGLEQELLRLGVAVLRRANGPERELRRRDRHAVVGADRLTRLEGEALRLVELVEVDEHHRERALRLAQRAAVAETLERTHGVAQELLGALGLALREGGTTDHHRHPR